MKKFKRLTKNRSVIIPKDIAAEAGITGGTAIDLISTDGTITIRRHVPVCIFCGEDVIRNEHCLCGKTICKKCVEHIREELI